jgi:hypothetical protein
MALGVVFVFMLLNMVLEFVWTDVVLLIAVMNKDKKEKEKEKDIKRYSIFDVCDIVSFSCSFLIVWMSLSCREFIWICFCFDPSGIVGKK